MNIKNKKILITGGHGFLGRHLVRALRDNGCNDLIIPTRDICDLRNAQDISDLLISKRPQIIFHLAASVGGIGANSNNPGKFFYDNAIMGIQLMEQARLSNVEKFITTGTVCSYPKFTPEPFKEEDLWNGYPEETNAPYGLAKKMLLVQGQAYKKQYGFNSIFLILVNLLGPGDNFKEDSSHVIPALIRKFQQAINKKINTVIIWGNGSASREFLHVTDAVKALVLASEVYENSDPVNIGTGKSISIAALVLMIADLMGYEGMIEWDNTKPNGQPGRMLDVTRAKKEFNFEAQVSLKEGLKETIQWYRNQNV